MPSIWHNSQEVCSWKLKELLSWLPQVASYKYCAQKILDLELKHICLLLGQFGHFFSDRLDEGSRGDVGERRVGGVVVGQALLGSGGGGQRGLLQAGVQAALLAVLPRQAGGRVVLVAGPRVSLDVARERDRVCPLPWQLILSSIGHPGLVPVGGGWSRDKIAREARSVCWNGKHCWYRISWVKSWLIEWTNRHRSSRTRCKRCLIMMLGLICSTGLRYSHFAANIWCRPPERGNSHRTRSGRDGRGRRTHYHLRKLRKSDRKSVV